MGINFSPNIKLWQADSVKTFDREKAPIKQNQPDVFVRQDSSAKYIEQVNNLFPYGELNDIYTKFGPDSYVSRCASVIMSTSETVFYVVALYFGTTKIKKLNGILAISFLAIGIGTICACWLCRIV